MVNIKKCPNCGTIFGENAKFCQNCGTRIPDEEKSTEGKPTEEKHVYDKRYDNRSREVKDVKRVSNDFKIGRTLGDFLIYAGVALMLFLSVLDLRGYSNTIEFVIIFAVAVYTIYCFIRKIVKRALIISGLSGLYMFYKGVDFFSLEQTMMGGLCFVAGGLLLAGIVLKFYLEFKHIR